MSKALSKRWETYHIPEGLLKYYKGMEKQKKSKFRPVLVICDNKELINKCLVVELGSKKNNDNHILWYKYYSRKNKCEKESWIKPDCIHTINRWYLNNKYRSHNKEPLTIEIKNKIMTYINSILNEK